jgi:hypothetical protein
MVKVTRLMRRLAPCNSDLAVCLEFMKIVDGGKSQGQILLGILEVFGVNILVM